MSKPQNQEDDEPDNRTNDPIYAIRKLGFMAAIAVTGLKLLFTGGVTFRLGATGRDIELPAIVVAMAGILSLLAAGFITVEHIARSKADLPDSHLLRRRVVLHCAWAVVALWVVFALAGVASAA